MQHYAGTELDDLLKVEEGLSEWEADFIDDMSRWKEMGLDFSKKQKAKIRQIWEKVCQNV